MPKTVYTIFKSLLAPICDKISRIRIRILKTSRRPIGILYGLWTNLFEHPANFFCWTGGTIALILIFAIPPFQAPDEHTHFYKAVYLAEGHLKAQILSPRVGAYLPARYQETAQHYSYMYLDHNRKVNVGILKRDSKHPITDDKPTATLFENTAVYPPLPYLPQATVIAATSLFTKSVLVQMYAARVAVLLSWLVLGYAAIRALPFGKWAAVALTLTPQSLFLAASVSGDALTFGLSLVLVSTIVKAMVQTGPMVRREIILIAVTAAALGLCKAPYFLLSGLVLAIPARRFALPRNRIMFAAGTLMLGVLLFIAWQLYIKSIFINVFPGSNSAGQIKFILHHPHAALSVILNTLLNHQVGDDLIVEMIGLKAWVDAHTPLWLAMMSYATIMLFCIWEPVKARLDYAYGVASRALSLIIAAIGTIAVALLLYISFTPVGKTDAVIGLQGRYLIPFSYLAIPAIGNTKLIPTQAKRTTLKIIALAMLMTVALSTLWLTVARYYLYH
jgi:uncharacterized membrane protein